MRRLPLLLLALAAVGAHAAPAAELPREPGAAATEKAGEATRKAEQGVAKMPAGGHLSTSPSETRKLLFVRRHPCPSTGKQDLGNCPGYTLKEAPPAAPGTGGGSTFQWVASAAK